MKKERTMATEGVNSAERVEQNRILPTEGTPLTGAIDTDVLLAVAAAVQAPLAEVAQVSEQQVQAPGSLAPLKGHVSILATGSLKVAAELIQQEGEEEEKTKSKPKKTQSTYSPDLKIEGTSSATFEKFEQKFPSSPTFIPTFVRIFHEAQKSEEPSQDRRELDEKDNQKRFDQSRRIEQEVVKGETSRSDQRITARTLETLKQVLVRSDDDGHRADWRLELKESLGDHIKDEQEKDRRQGVQVRDAETILDQALFGLWSDQIFFDTMDTLMEGRVKTELQGRNAA